MTRHLGYCTYDGIFQIMSASYTRNHGITPSVCTIDFPPQIAPPEPEGTLTFWYDGVAIVEFPKSKLDMINVEGPESGIIARAQIFDRRWMWRFGKISGVYNFYETDKIIKWETAPQDLAKLCLAAMNETNYDVSQLPNDSRPYTSWDGTNPAQALANLCELLGCRVVLRCDNTVKLCQTGTGNALPLDLNIMLGTAGFDPPESPDAYGILGARIMFQMDLHLKPVAEDIDGIVKDLNSVSYKPAGGWAGFTDIGGWNNIADPKVKELADKWVLKGYAIDDNDERNYEIPGLDDGEEDDEEDDDEELTGFISYIDQMLPLLDCQCDTVTETVSGVSNTRFKEPMIYGKWFDKRKAMNSTMTDPDTDVELQPIHSDVSPTAKPLIFYEGFSIDHERGIVFFNEPVYRINIPSDEPDQVQTDKGQTMVPAQLILRIAVNIRGDDDNQFVRHERLRPSGTEFGTEPRWDLHEEIQRKLTPTYGTDWTVTAVDDNASRIDGEADFYLNAMQQEYILTDPITFQYADIRFIELDGTIQQVSWTVGPSGATTRASYNNDYHPATVSWKERRMNEKLAALAKKNAPFGGGVVGMGF